MVGRINLVSTDLVHDGRRPGGSTELVRHASTEGTRRSECCLRRPVIADVMLGARRRVEPVRRPATGDRQSAAVSPRAAGCLRPLSDIAFNNDHETEEEVHHDLRSARQRLGWAWKHKTDDCV